jgi:hypothetical protein
MQVKLVLHILNEDDTQGDTQGGTQDGTQDDTQGDTQGLEAQISAPFSIYLPYFTDGQQLSSKRCYKLRGRK